MPRPDDDRENADPSFLFHEEETEPDPAEFRTREATGPKTPLPGDGGYELADDEPVSPDPPPPPRVRDPAPTSPPAPRERKPAKREIIPADVDQPWSRLAEWGADLGRVGIALAATVGLVFLLGPVVGFGLGLLLGLIGLAAAVLLSYPIAVTLERPVRLTPEQALKDYYAALSHHFPHHRRMWLLLSSAGRSAPEFGGEAGFRAYWKDRLAQLRGGRVKASTPLTFKVDDFKADKSAGLDAVEGRYTLNVLVRGQESEGPIYSGQAKSTFSRGPDRMWYLDDGTLPVRS